jgi:DNA-binding response OmpR family regulator
VNPSPLAYGPLVLDADGFCVTVDGCDIPVTYVEFMLLSELMHHPFQIVSIQRLLILLNDARPNGSLRMSPGSLRTHVTRLRAKLGGAGVPSIKTMRRVGYGFVPPAEPVLHF